MRYCRKCDKDFDNDCYFCSYCGEQLDYDEDRKPEGFLQGLNKRKWHLFNVAIMVIISMAPFWYRNVFAGKGTLYVLAYFSGFFGLYNILLSNQSKDELLFSYNLSHVCYVVCIICGMMCS